MNNDLISRQEAIDALADMHCKSDEDGYVWIIRSDAWARIDALPSAQPEPCDDPRADVYYLAEKIGIHRLYALVVALRGEPEPCEDAVSRKAVYDAMVEKGQRSRRYKLGEIWELNGTEIREALDTVPSVTPEQKRGKWEEKAVSDEKVIDEWQSARCSACGKYHTAPYMYYFNNYNFCPNCGARMTKEDV